VTKAYDAVVVGGGIIGCACAYELASRGARVALIERDRLAAGASGRNHGLLLVPIDPPLMPMAQSSTQMYEAVVHEAPLRVHLDAEPIGFLIVASNDQERAAGRAEADAAAACGVITERMDGSSLRRLEPGLAPELADGWLLHDARRVDPAALTVAMAMLARDLAAEILAPLTVRALIERGGVVEGVVTDEGPVLARTVVLAAGPWSTGLLRPLAIDLPIAGARGWLVHLSGSEATPTRLIGRAGWHVVSEHQRPEFATAGSWASHGSDVFLGALVQPNPDGTVLVGGSRQWAITDEPEDPDVPRGIVRGAAGLIPGLAATRILSAWWGVRPVTLDDRPIVGVAREGLVVASGHGSQGVILGGGTAQLVGAIVRGDPPPFDPAPFAPDRFPRTMAS
jgi:glycine/D-amino acid oxidase-like deaminating enzyme